MIAECICGADEVFVFGSNLSGYHGAGAAYTALKEYGAVYGRGDGIQGRSYALPTMDRNIQPLPLSEIAERAKTFLDYAAAHPEQKFFLTRVACGLGGKSDKEIAPLFRDAPSNVRIPPEFLAVLEAA